MTDAPPPPSDESPDRASREHQFDLALIETPGYFRSEETEAPFQTCIDCGQSLTSSEQGSLVPHMVQKLMVRGESVFEFAICQSCSQSMQEWISEETRQNLQQFFSDKLASVQPVSVVEAEQGLLSCLLCDRNRDECQRYTLIGYLAGKYLQVNPGPLLVCEKCEESLSKLVSKKSRDGWDRFVEEHFDSPPGVGMDLPDGMPMLI